MTEGSGARTACAALALWCCGTVAFAEGGPLIKNGQKVAFLGDSITANGWATKGGYVRLVVDGLQKEGITVTPVPAGVSGNTSRDMLARLTKDVLQAKPDWLTVSCGVNDVWHGAKGVELPAYQQNIVSIIDQAQAAGIKVILFTATPIGEDANPNNEKLTAYNDFLRQLAKDRNLPLADQNRDFREALGKFPERASSRYLTVDGVHMNAEGNVIMAKGCLRAMGLPAEETEKIEQAWLNQPETASFAAKIALRQEADLTLAQFRALEKLALGRSEDVMQTEGTLWLQSLGEVLQEHAKEPSLDAAKIDQETRERLLRKIADLPPA
ncbi:SGNH/GDSL hydrolase family protein [Verrucomicrobium sp. GAS474]|uniref:SGNH/GDSL hydrolase family protein n=1 Tax=Verrucomicrobium sp. GAS474 TaxID=1882831 RepID=UPI0012FF60B6|nr:SGNH/GDSL hydrolase family protein [Verrucomicrobium sp. GAS474]